MSRRWFCAALVGLSLAACGVAPAEEEAESATDELRLCRDDAAVLADRTAGKTPLLASADVQVAATLPYPPGNVAASAGGRLFVSMFPDTNHGSVKVGEIAAGGALVPFPTRAFQDTLHAVLGIRMDRQGRLWILDHGKMGLHRPKLYVVSVAAGTLERTITFDDSLAPLGSMLNDVQVSPDGKTAYVSDASIVRGRPALLVVDLAGTVPVVRRVLERHPSVMAGAYDIVVGGKKAKVAGLLCAEAGVDGIALDPSGEYLYYAALNAGVVQRIATRVLRDPKAPAAALAASVEKWADATMTDGMTSDAAGNVYLSDMEHSSVVRIRPDRTLEVVAKDARLRWPDGFAWAPNGDLFVSASAAHETLRGIPTKGSVERGGPYHVLRLRTANVAGR
jgi:sugar lactone lactonase YvrE